MLSSEFKNKKSLSVDKHRSSLHDACSFHFENAIVNSDIGESQLSSPLVPCQHHFDEAIRLSIYTELDAQIDNKDENHRQELLKDNMVLFYQELLKSRAEDDNQDCGEEDLEDEDDDIYEFDFSFSELYSIFRTNWKESITEGRHSSGPGIDPEL